MNHSENLKQLFAFSKENKHYLDAVIKLIKDNHAVVPFVGAGLSVPIYPTWPDFFSNVVSEATIRPSAKETIESLLARNNYEKAASVLKESVGDGGYTDCIKNTFSEDKITAGAVGDMAVSMLPHIFRNTTAITTNFDRLLKKVFENAHCPFTETLTPYEDSDVVKGAFHQGTEQYLLKLHGDYLHTDRITFTEERYDECYGKNLDSPYVSFITETLSSKVLLFLGCSLDADRTTKLLEKIALHKKRTHYAIVEMPSDTFGDAFFDKAKRLSDMGILCIWYPKGKHAYVNSALAYILEQVNGSARKGPPAVITTTSVQKPSKDFLGRDKDIEEIKESLKTAQKLVLVNGIGGIGKSQICSSMYYEYVSKSADDIEYLGWISYDTDLKSSIFQSVESIRNITDVNEYFAASKAEFNKLGGKLLLFIDNANNLSPEAQKQIASLTCRVVVTSRNKDFGESFIPIEVGYLPKKECIDLYIKTLGKEEDRKIVAEIVERAASHTITVVLLAKTQKSARMPAEELLEALATSDFNLSGIKETIKHDDKNLVFIEHLTHLFEIVDLLPEEIRLLKVFSLMPYKFLKHEYAKQWFALDSYNEVNTLIDKGWLLDDGNNGLLMHPVISAVVGVNYKISFDECEETAMNIADTLHYTPFENYTDKWEFLPFAVSVAEYFEEQVLNNKTLALLFSNMGCTYQNQGDYDKALEFHNKALPIHEKVLGTEHPDTAATYNNIASVYYAQKDYSKALEFYNKDLAISEKVLGTEHPDTAITYNNIAVVYKYQGDYDKALEFYHKALVIKEKALRADHPSISTTYNNIATVYEAQGDYNKALEFFNKALPIREKVLGTEHPDTAVTYNNIAAVYEAQGDYNKALEFYHKALEIFNNELGERHFYTKATLNNLQRLKNVMFRNNPR